MEIKITLPPNAQPASAAEIKPMVDSWRAGQIIKASVHSVSDDHTMALRIGDKLVIADAKASSVPIPLQNFRPQQELLLKVVEIGTRPTLELTAPPPAPRPDTDALRQTLPRQQPLPQLLSNLAAISRFDEAKLVAPLKAIRKLAETFIAALPQAKEVQDPEGLKRAINNSGPLLEHKLATAPKGEAPVAADKDLSKDLKANLSRLVQSLQSQAPEKATARAQLSPPQNPAPPLDPATLLGTASSTARPASAALPPVTQPTEPLDESTQKILLEAPPPVKAAPPQPQPRLPPQVDSQWPFERLVLNLLDQAEGALARVRVNQLSHTGDEQTSLQTWTIELPIKDQNQIDVVALQINREGNGKRAAHEVKWTVTLAFDFEQTGPFLAKVGLQDKTVSVNITAEQASTAARINHALPQLEQSLVSAGLDVQQLNVAAGPVPRGARSQLYQSLVDTHV